jgi:alpha-glucan, water dikinase
VLEPLVHLRRVQGQSASPAKGGRVVLSAELGGLEDVPPGVAAVLTTSPVDLLSHIAIRARNGSVLLATCSDSAVWDALVKEHSGECVEVSAGPGSGDVTVTVAAAQAGASGISSGAGGDRASSSAVARKLRKPSKSIKWVLTREAFAEGAVGGKSLGLARLAQLAASGGFTVPPAFALPYGSFERALAAAPGGAQDAFAAAVSELDAAAPATSKGDLDMAKVRSALEAVRGAVTALPLPEALAAEIKGAVEGQGGALTQWSAIADDGGSSEQVRRAGVLDVLWQLRC